MPTHAYYQRWRLYANSDFPLATVANLISGVYKHASSGSSKACFYKTRITTEAGSNTKWSLAWYGVTLEPSIYTSRSLNWKYDDFHANDKNLNVAQIMVVPFYTNEPCSEGMSYSPAVTHYSNWEVY